MSERLLPLQLDGAADVLILMLRPRVQGIPSAPQPSQDHLRLLNAPGFDQPPRTLGHEEDQNHEHQHRYDLESERKPPAEAACPITHEADAILEPVSGDQADVVEGELERDEEAADILVRRFGGPDGEDPIEDSGAHSGDDPCTEDPGGVHGARLGRRRQCYPCVMQKPEENQGGFRT